MMEIQSERDEGQAQIERALEIAEAQRQARTHANRGEIVSEHLQRLSEGYAPTPRQTIQSQFFDLLGRWEHIKQHPFAGVPGQRFAKARSLEALELIDDALNRLGARTGLREADCRESLKAQRARIAEALAAFDALGSKLDAPKALELIERSGAVRQALDAAYRAKELATRETVETTSLELERCLVDSRQLDRDIAAALASIAIPEFPRAADFDKARRDTIDTEAMPAKRPTARQVHRAIEAGMSASPAVSRLWIIYETQPDHECVKWRWRAVEGE